MGADWARSAVVYQVYVRSFADADGDGVGDLAGVHGRLDYLAALGVDAVWLTPFYASPMIDGGYDVADYRAVDPTFGTLGDMDALLADAHARGLRVIVDVVPNHTSDRHAWFREALAGEPGARDRYIFRPGRDGGPPNNWRSVFGGPAWTRLPDGDWYLHLFAPEQPDLNWADPRVRDEFDGVLRFWLDRGVDGIRVDVAHGLIKPPGLPDATDLGSSGRRPYFDQDGVHEIYRRWRRLLDGYDPPRVAVAEARLRDVARTALYVRPDELHQAFNFDFLWAPWSLPSLRDAIDRSLAAMGAVGALPTWVIGNHDEARAATRLAAGTLRAGMADRPVVSSSPLDAAVGLRRARALALVSLALPGSAYVYQGDELGLPEVLDLPPSAREDPIWRRSGGELLGRDGCRVPIPWSGDAPPYGFGPDGSQPWLPQPTSWADLSVARQLRDPRSTLSLYAAALRLRKSFVDEPFRWLPAPEGVLTFERGPGLACALNFGPDPAQIPGRVVLASEPGEVLIPNTAAWYTPT
ncbi:glycoside hydrolase family 13 protein [Micromonospora sp. CPCC 205371]|nr:glycoside hydrolase family 13 protein [Micromonospora sp. CPCC 205371]